MRVEMKYALSWNTKGNPSGLPLCVLATLNVGFGLGFGEFIYICGIYSRSLCVCAKRGEGLKFARF